MYQMIVEYVFLHKKNLSNCSNINMYLPLTDSFNDTKHG